MASMASDSARAAQRQRWLHQLLGTNDLTLTRASDDAGLRSYWRILTDQRSLILMDAPPALEPVAPWLQIHALLSAGGVRVPEVLAADDVHGFVLLEDLGANTCLHVLNPDTADSLITACIEQLLRIQAIALPPAFPVYDRALLLRDLRLFDQWFLSRHLGITLDALHTQRLFESYRFLIESALAQPQVLVHRDFMPRNLMPGGDEIAVIDFQGAVRGPIAYDIVSLLKDAFISWPQAETTRWLRHYHQCALARHLPVPTWKQLQRDTDLIGVHRHLKVLGIFARLSHRDHKPRYLEDAPRFSGDSTLS